MSNVPCLHVGWPKCGSKTLQYGLFGKHSQIRAIGKPYDTDDRTSGWITDLYMLDALQFDAEKSKRAFEEYVRPLLADDRTLVLSWELFTLPQHADRSLVANRLRDQFGRAKIIVNIRSQLDQIRSMYLFQRGRGLRPESFDRFLRQNLERPYVGNWLDYVHYWKVIDHYCALFGQENVGVFLLEDLIADSDEYARRLCKFIGVDGEEGARHVAGAHENRGKSATMSAYTRFRKRFTPNVVLKDLVPAGMRQQFHRALNRGQKATAEFPPDLVESLRDRYRQGNRKLAERFNLPLAARGYPV